MKYRNRDKGQPRIIVGELSEFVTVLFSRIKLGTGDDVALEKEREKTFMRDVASLLVDLVTLTVEETRSYITRNGKTPDTVDVPIESFALKYGFESRELCTYLLESISICQMFEYVLDYISDNPFDIYESKVVGPFIVVEHLGDYRILEWEMDHVVEGEYVSKKG